MNINKKKYLVVIFILTIISATILIEFSLKEADPNNAVANYNLSPIELTILKGLAYVGNKTATSRLHNYYAYYISEQKGQSNYGQKEQTNNKTPEKD